MIWVVLLLLGIGVFLSAFFSGSETGFYRVARIRLVLDALDGDVVSRVLLWLTNNPALFVATTLIGNNLANYVMSLGIVLAVQLVSGQGHLGELVAPVVLSPIVFIYCELLPKQLFFQAPNRLLRRSGPLLLIFTLFFSLIAALLWLFGRFLQSVIGETPLRVRLTLARKELQQVFQEGQEAGILHPSQRELAQSLFANASQNVLRFSTPLIRDNVLPLGADKQLALQLARRLQSPIVPIRQADGEQLAGYVRVIDLQLDPADTIHHVHPLVHVSKHDSHIKTLMRMQQEKTELACVEDEAGSPIALLYVDRLTAPLFAEA